MENGKTGKGERGEREEGKKERRKGLTGPSIHALNCCSRAAQPATS